jgi:ATP-dependent Clp protease ATP-binding subunit ClpA
MAKVYYNIYQTNAFVSQTLMKIIFTPVTLGAVFLASFVILLIGLLSNIVIPAMMLVFVLLFLLLVSYLFIYKKLRGIKEEPLIYDNVACHLSYDVARSLTNSPLLSHKSLFTAAIKSERGAFVIHRMGLDVSVIEKELVGKFDDSMFKESPMNILERLFDYYKKVGEAKIDGNLILLAYIENEYIFKPLLDRSNLSQEDFEKIVEWEAMKYLYSQKPPTFSPRGLLKSYGFIGRTWTLGYTNALDMITRDISEDSALKDPEPVVIHEREMQQVMNILSKSNNHNVLLVGEVGVGKRTMVNNLALFLRKYQIKENANLSRVLWLRVADLLSGVDNPAGFLLEALAKAESSGNIILVVDQISLLISSNDANVKNVVGKFLNSPRVSVIGIDSTANYHSYIKVDPVLDSMLEKMTIQDSTEQETISILMTETFRIEETYGVNVTFQAVKSIWSLTRRYLTKGGFPGKAVETLADAANRAYRYKSKFVLESHIRELISEKTNMDITKVQEEEKKVLLSLHERLAEEVIGQEEAIVSVANALKRARMDVGVVDKPMGTFLFLGPTGVGKTETAKALAKHYFGSKDRMIRLDMNEYNDEKSIYGIIGAPVGSGDSKEGFLAKEVQDHPFSIVLLDEIEKAHKNVLMLFLRILDEGSFMDSRGVHTDFRNTIIIATSNAGALFIRDFMKAHPDGYDHKEFEKALLDLIIKEKLFAPEFLNRFTDVVVYYPLTKPTIEKIARKMLGGLISRFDKDRGVIVQVADDAIELLAEEGYSIEFGAREMERTITEAVENYLADYLLMHDIERGDVIKIERSNIQPLLDQFKKDLPSSIGANKS